MGKREPENKTIYSTTSMIGVLLALSCFEHGLFETLHGYNNTPGYFIHAIGKEIRWWSNGTEDAFTVIPNYLVTGVVVIIISIFAAIWSIKYIRTNYGNLIFLTSFTALTLFGGGIGHIPFYITAWSFSLKAYSRLVWWKKRIKKRSGLYKLMELWRVLLVTISILWLLAVEIAIFGYFPGVEEESTLLAICWGLLLATLLLIVITYIASIIIDVKKEKA